MEPAGWQETFCTFLTVSISVTLTISALYILWKGYKVPRVRTGALFMLAGAVWIGAFKMELESALLPAKVFWSKMQYAGITMVPTMFLVYLIQYTDHKEWLTHRNLALLSIVPLTTLLLAFTNESHGLIWSSVELTGPPPSELEKTFHTGYWFFVVFSYGVILMGVSLLLQMLVHGYHLYRWQASVLLLAAFAALLTSVIDILGLNPLVYIDMTPLGIGAAGLIVAWNLVRLRLADIVPIAREAIIDDMSDGVIVLDQQNRIMDVNPLVQQLIGYPTSELIGQPVQEMWPDLPSQLGLSRGEARGGGEIVIDLNGQHTYDAKISPLTDWRGSLVSQIVVLRDITERQQAEKKLHESEEKFRTIFENANDLIVYMDKQGVITDINQKTGDVFGLNPEEFIGKSFFELEIHNHENIPELKRFFRDMSTDGSLMPSNLMELELRKRNRDKVFVEVSTRLIKKNGKVEGILSILRDITERKQTEEKIKTSLKEKEVLLQEIHHRVKNNLQVVSSLLNLQSKYIKDKKYVEMLKESQNRIKTISLLYEKLYQSENLANINFKDYIAKLATGLFQSYGISTTTVTLTVTGDDIPLGVDTAIPCGLIINELVSNCLKHAFPHRKGEITVSFYARGGMAELIVADNGVGIPDDIDFKNTETLGLQLVRILAEDQLDGNINLTKNGGTQFRITFREGE